MRSRSRRGGVSGNPHASHVDETRDANHEKHKQNQNYSRQLADATTDDSILDLLGATDRGLPSSMASLGLAA